MNVGERIKALRQDSKLTLRELSQKVDISISFLSDIENGRSNPSLERLKDIAKALDTTTSYLLGEEPTPTPESSSDVINEALKNDPELKEFWDKLVEREDLKLLMSQVKDADPVSVRKLIKIIKAIEDEEERNS